MRFSIVTPTYNHAKYIETTIKSVIANKSDKYELEYIVIDGGSDDGTQEVVEKYRDEIAKFVSESDEGQADAINKGFTYATGDIYAYINSDDYYFPDAFEKVASFFEENPDVDFVYGDCVFVDEEGRFRRYFTEIEPYDRFRLTSCSDFIMQPASFWRKEAFEKIGGFDKKYHFGFDWDAWSKMAKNGSKFHYLKELLAVNREFEETKTQSGGSKRLAELKTIILKNKESIWPHAYYSYAFAEESMKEKSQQNIFKKIFYKLASYKGVVYNQIHWNDRHLYGTNHHSSMLRKEAFISFPFYHTDAKYFAISLTIPHQLDSQSFVLNINNLKKIEYRFSKSKNFAFLLFDISGLDLEKIEIEIQFDKAVVDSFGMKNKLLMRKVEVAAFFHYIDVLRSDVVREYADNDTGVLRDQDIVMRGGDIELIRL